MTYDEWADRYLDIFGLVTEAGMQMVREWKAMFQRAGYTPEELNDATEWLALNSPPEFPDRHIVAFQSRLRAQREAKQRAILEDPDDRGTCSLCGGSGMVSVPCPRALARGLWQTAAVLCQCPLGLWLAERQRGRSPDGSPRPPLLTLAEYESIRPDWRRLMRDREEQLQAEARILASAKALNPIIGRILSRLKK